MNKELKIFNRMVRQVNINFALNMKYFLLVFSLLSYYNTLCQTYNIVKYGANPNGKTLSTEAIQKAIDACGNAGGGTVLIPAGTFLSGTLFLASNIRLEISEGAVLMASNNLQDYQEDTKGEKHFIVADSAKNIVIAGNGIIDGQGSFFWDEKFKPLARPVGWIYLKNIEHLKIHQVNLQHSPSHTIRIQNCKFVNIDGITIENHPRSPNTDGIDLVDTQYVTISNCIIRTGDDAICLKSKRRPVENITVSNCILESDDAAIKFGTGSANATRFCNFNNLVIKNTRYGISLFMLDGGVFEHNRFSNIIIETGGRHPHTYPIFIDIDKRVDNRNYGTIRNNTFEKLNIITSGKILISGHTEKSIESISLRDIHIYLKEIADFSKASKPRGNKNFPKLASSVDLSRKRAHVILSNIEYLELDNIKIATAPNVSQEREDFLLENIKESNFKEIDKGIVNPELKKDEP